MTQIPELEALMSAVEAKHGEPLRSTTGFERLAGEMLATLGESLGASTLKRLWGYVPGATVPRLSTLNLLARYVSYADFKSFRQAISARDDSGYVTKRACVTSDELEKDDELVLGWAPDRVVRLRYLGEDRFEVLSSEHSKLRPGDVFMQSCFLKGWPLYVPCIWRGGEATPPFVAGKAHGLTLLEKQ